MTVAQTIQEKITKTIATLPENSLVDVMTFLEYLQYRQEQTASQSTPYVPISLSGLWSDMTITDETINEVRHEMWSNFGERD